MSKTTPVSMHARPVNHEMEPGHGSLGHRVSDFDRVGSRVSVSDPVFDQAVCFNMRVYRGVVSIQSNTISTFGKLISA